MCGYNVSSMVSIYGYGRVVSRVFDVPVPLATLTETEVTLCTSV